VDSLGWTSANFLDELNSPVIPGTSCFHGNWVEDVRACLQFIIFINIKNEFD